MDHEIEGTILGLGIEPWKIKWKKNMETGDWDWMLGFMVFMAR